MVLAEPPDMLTRVSSVNLESLELLRTRLTGQLVLSDSPEYEQLRRPFALGPDRYPLAIVRPTIERDVSEAITFAREEQVPLAVRSGGHSLARHGVADGAIVIDLSSMKEIRIDPVGRLARVQAGATTGDLAGPANSHGLALSTGDTTSVGIGGLATGGGVGLMARAYGLTIDNLVSARVALADGSIVTASAIECPDLFWAIRGGGGNFGIVTEFTFRLAPVANVVGGNLLLPVTLDVLRGYRDYVATAPDHLTTIANIMRIPPFPNIPDELVGQMALSILACWSGDQDEAEAVLAPLRALAEPFADMIGPMPYPQMFAFTQHQAMPHGAVVRMMFADDLSDEVLELSLEAIRASPVRFCAIQLRGLGGAISRVDPLETAYAYRDKPFALAVLGGWLSEAEDPAPVGQWTESIWEKVREYGSGTYVNFLGEEGEDRVREAYPHQTWERLTRIKAHYDPENLFRLNQNITPAE